MLCITHLPQIAAYGATHFQIAKTRRGRAGRSTGVARLDGAGARRGDRADDWRQRRSRRPSGPAPREMLRGPADRGERRIQSERRKRKVARKRSRPHVQKYLIETFGCQMNVHDSERMAGLLEQAGYEPTRGRPRRRRHRDQHLQRPRAGRGEAVHAARRDPAAGARSRRRARSSPSPAASRSRKARSILAALVTPSTSSSAPRAQAAADAGRAGDRHGRRAGTPRRRPRPATTTCRFRSGSRGAADPLKAYVTIIEGCNEFCAFCVVPVHARPRADAAGRATSSPRRARRSATGAREVQLLGQIVNHYQAPDDPACDFAALLERLNEIDGLERIRFASPHPRHVTPRMIAAMRDLPKVCRHLHLPVQSGSTRVLAAMRRRHTREEYLDAGRPACARPCRTSRCRPI